MVTVAKFQMRVSVARLLGIIFAVLAVVLVVVDDQFRRRKTRRSDEELLAAKLHVLVVPVSSLGEPRPREPIDVDRFSHLARLAQYLERPVLYQLAEGQRTYAVDDELRQYRYRPTEDELYHEAHPGDGGSAPDPSRSDEPPGRPPPDRAPSHRRDRPSWRSMVAQGMAAVVVVAIAATLITSFTASTNVPVSKAGTSVQPRQVSQLAPAGCGSLNLTRLVTGSGSFSNGFANALILGSPGNDTIADTGGNSCIVPGGGADSVTGVASDICISGPALNVAAACPAPSTSNGVGAVASSDNYNNYGGQERLAVTNTGVITAMTITIKVAQTPACRSTASRTAFPGGI